MLSSPIEIEFFSWSGHTGTVVGLDDGTTDGCSVGSYDILGVEVTSIDGYDEGYDDDDGIELGVDEVDGVIFDSIVTSLLEAD
jgi:hypothetical protein